MIELKNGRHSGRFKLGANMIFTPTNNQLSQESLTKLISKLETTVPNFPQLKGKTVSYDYEADIISLTWDDGYHVSEDHGWYVLDFNYYQEIIGIELLHFNPEEGD